MRQILLASLLTLASLIEECQPISEEDYQKLTLDVMNELASKLEALADGTKYSYGEAHTLQRDAMTKLVAQYSRRLLPLKEDGMIEKFLQDVHSYCRVKHAFKQMLQGRRAEPGRFGNEKICDDLKREKFKKKRFKKSNQVKDYSMKTSGNDGYGSNQVKDYSIKTSGNDGYATRHLHLRDAITKLGAQLGDLKREKFKKKRFKKSNQVKDYSMKTAGNDGNRSNLVNIYFIKPSGNDGYRSNQVKDYSVKTSANDGYRSNQVKDYSMKTSLLG